MLTANPGALTTETRDTGEIPAEGAAGRSQFATGNENRNAIRDSAVLCQFGLG